MRTVSDAASDHGCKVDLSIIIVNWNSAGLLRKCLTSIYDNVRDVGFEVLVVDNASYDGCKELIDSQYPDVRFFQNERNVGFAQANNGAVHLAKGATLLFLNSDTEVIGPAVQRMFTCINANPAAGAVGAKLLNSDGSVQSSCLQAFPSLLNQFLDAAYLRSVFPGWSLWGNGVLFRDCPDAVAVDGIVGACLMIRKAVFEELGGFHDQFFMYVEDMDLCYRLRAAGRTNYYLGTATIIHHGGQSSDAQPDKQFAAVMMRESVRSFLRIHRGPLYGTLYQCSTAVAAVCRLAALSVALLLPAGSEHRNSVRRALAKWRRILYWTAGLEEPYRAPA